MARLPSDTVFRRSAVALLGGGIALALWQDPALLDRRDVTLALAGGFAGLWMVPVLRAGWVARRAAAQAAGAAPIQPMGEGRDARWALELGFGALAGFIAGALVMSVPRLVAMLGQGPALVDRAFDAARSHGLVVLVALALAGVVLLRLVQMAVMGAVRTSRFAAAFVVALCLWVPFHEPFAAGFRLIGLDLPSPRIGDPA